MAKMIPIEDRLTTAGWLAGRARVFYDLWRFYEGEETKPRILDTMNYYPQFFVFDSHAQFVACIVHVAALFEKSDRNVNLASLTAELGSSIPAATGTEIAALTAQAEPLKPKVIYLRSNLFAHRSAKVTYSDAFKQAGLTPNQLGDLTEIAFRIANLLLFAKALPYQVFNPYPLADAKKILSTLSLQIGGTEIQFGSSTVGE